VFALMFESLLFVPLFGCDVTGQGLEFRVRYFVLSLVMDLEIWPGSFDLDLTIGSSI